MSVERDGPQKKKAPRTMRRRVAVTVTVTVDIALIIGAASLALAQFSDMLM